MTKCIIHSVVFLLVASALTTTILNLNSGDENSGVYLLPVLLLVGVYLGILFVLYVLPSLSDKATHAVYDSGARVDHDPFHDARSAHARGEYQEAIALYLSAAELEPNNRLPWVEIAKIQHDNLEDPDAAIRTLSNALEEKEWSINDAAYFMSKLSDLYMKDKHDRESSATILRQIIETFPETRHSANATHKLRELGAF